MKLNFFAPSNNLGYGIHAHGLMKALHLRGHSLCLIPTMNDLSYVDEFVKMWYQNQQLFDVNNPSLMIFHAGFLSQFSGRPRIGFPVFEIDHFSDQELAMMRSCDFLLATSRWAQQILQARGFTAQVVNEGVDVELYAPTEKRGARPFRFGHVGKWEVRKSGIEIIQAYLKAVMHRHESTELFLHSFNPFLNINQVLSQIKAVINTMSESFYTEQKENRCVFAADNWKIIVPITQFESSEQMANLYNTFDVGIYPAKAEGWNLPLIETLSCGVPCIATNVTGQNEYFQACPDFLKLNKLQEVPAQDGVWFHGQGTWFQSDVEEMTEKITWCLNRPQEMGQIGKECRAVVEQFSWDHAAQQLEEILK